MSHPPAPRHRGYWGRLRRQKDQILNVRASETRHLPPLARAIAAAGRSLAHPLFSAAELLLHLAWLGVNALGPVPLRWDPYPFPLLAGLASVQALFIGLLILMYEERNAQIAELREETEPQVNLHTEREAIKLLRMVAEIHHRLGIASTEPRHGSDGNGTAAGPATAAAERPGAAAEHGRRLTPGRVVRHVTKP